MSSAVFRSGNLLVVWNQVSASFFGETGDKYLLAAWSKVNITLGWFFYRSLWGALHSQTPPIVSFYCPRLSSCSSQNSSTTCLRTSRAFEHMRCLWSEGNWVRNFNSMRYWFCHRRRLDSPIDRPDFLTEIGKADESEDQLTKVQLAAHAVDFM